MIIPGVSTSGCALMIACRLVLCGSSVYVQKKCSSLILFSVEVDAGSAGVLLSPLTLSRAEVVSDSLLRVDDMVVKQCAIDRQ